MEEFNSETLVLASDGSVLMDDATQAWILFGMHTDTRAYGHGPVPRGGQPLTSLCAEVGGYVCLNTKSSSYPRSSHFQAHYS